MSNKNTEVIENIEYFLLHDKVIVFKNLLPNVEKMVDVLKRSEDFSDKSMIFADWQPWATFGKYIYMVGSVDQDKESMSDEQRIIFEEELAVYKKVQEAFYISTNYWLKTFGYQKEDDWFIQGPSFSRYFMKDKTSPGYVDGPAMFYHTDFVQLRAEEPGNKFILTCTMYLNDDYSGGDISFITNTQNNEEIIYKPEAGDILVFPSGHPDYFGESGDYMHAVKEITSGTKYLVRCFYQKPYAGSEKWHEGLQKYGAEQWFAMEDQRVKERRKSHDETVYIKNCGINS